MINVLVPENDKEELWELNGRVKALQGFLRRQKRHAQYTVEIEAVEAILFEEEERCRKCGHPSEE